MGGRPPDVTDDQIVDAVRRALDETGEPVVFAQEIKEHSEAITIQTDNLYPRLKDLRDEGRICGKNSGNSWAWWLPDAN